MSLAHDETAHPTETETCSLTGLIRAIADRAASAESDPEGLSWETVSYTHLTLPTIYTV